MAKNKSLVPLQGTGKTLWGESGARMDGEEPSAAKHATGHVVQRAIGDEFNYLQYRAEEQLDAIVRERVASHYTQATAAQSRLQIATGRWDQDWGRVENANNYVDSSVSTAEFYDTCVAFNSLGEPLLLALDNSVQKIEVFNPRTGALLSTSDDLKDDLPSSGGSEVWKCYSMCTDGTSVYVFCTNTQPASDEHVVQAWDISTWNVKTNWPTTGTSLPGVGARSDNEQNDIIIANDTYLATANSWTAIVGAGGGTACISVLELADGTLGAGFSGSGDGTATYVITSLASDGTYLYCTSEVGGAYELSTAIITDPDNPAGSGGTGYPLALSTQGPHFIASCGDMIATSPNAAGTTATDVVLRSHNATTAALGQMSRGRDSSAGPLTGDKYIFQRCLDLTYDGLNLWLTIKVDSAGGTDPVCLLKIDAAKLMDKTTTSVPQIGDLTGSLFQMPVISASLKPTTFDGRDIWVISDWTGSVTHSGRLHRLPIALLRH